ncbi:MAG: hypothetical protein KGS60_17635 [Verrucomicrobia bacterium]|jgi:hypothetical protein|nr:hypothetical protein [Verrucomicrobiota bacterium]
MEVPPHLLPPQKLTRLWEDGQLSRQEYHAAMAIHAKLIIEEMVEARDHPALAYLDQLLNQHAAAKLKRRYGEAILREAMLALAEIPGFPPAVYLWNAGHWHVPLHCFLRSRKEPVFRIRDLRVAGPKVVIRIEHGSKDPRQVIREEVTLRRNRIGEFVAEERIQS